MTTRGWPFPILAAVLVSTLAVSCAPSSPRSGVGLAYGPDGPHFIYVGCPGEEGLASVELLSSPDGKARVLWRAEATAKGMRTVQLGHPDAGWRESMPLTGQLPDSELAVHAVTGRGNAAELRFRLADLNEAKVWSGRRLESRDRFHKSRDCP